MQLLKQRPFIHNLSSSYPALDRQFDSNLGTRTHLAAYTYRTAVGFGYFLGNRKSQTRAARIGGARLFNTVEALEQSRQVFFGNAYAVVAYTYEYRFVVRTCAQDYQSAVGSVFDRV